MIPPLTITVGPQTGPSTGTAITVPLSSLRLTGSAETSVYTYSKTLGEVEELKKFQINNARRKWVLATNELEGTGIPASSDSSTSCELPIVLDVPTDNGVVRMQTTVELKRKAGSKSWKR